MAGAALHAQVAETHTGLVMLLGALAYKVKKPVVTDFLDFSTPASRERACAHEVELNRRLAPDSYLGVGHFQPPQGGEPEPVIVMRRHPDEARLATMIGNGQDVAAALAAIAETLAAFHATARRGPDVDAQARVDAVTARWQENMAELSGYTRAPETGGVPGLDPAAVAEVERRALEFLAGRTALLNRRIAAGRIVDGHADLLADDIFCLPDGPALLDCLEFDDTLRYVDAVDDAAFLAMDLEYLGRTDLAEFFFDRYLDRSGDDAPESLRHFYIAYRAVVRAKVDCVRHTQGVPGSAADAHRHLQLALEHLRAGAVRLILVGGAPGTGKTTLARALSETTGAEVISTDDVRAELTADGEITGDPGVLGSGLYAPENVEAVYRAVLARARVGLSEGRTVVLDGTWTDAGHRQWARAAAAECSVPLIEFACVAPLDAAVSRIRTRSATTSQVTPEIATALARDDADNGVWPGAHRIDTTGEPAEARAEALHVCRTNQLDEEI